MTPRIGARRRIIGELRPACRLYQGDTIWIAGLGWQPILDIVRGQQRVVTWWGDRDDEHVSWGRGDPVPVRTVR